MKINTVQYVNLSDVLRALQVSDWDDFALCIRATWGDAAHTMIHSWELEDAWKRWIDRDNVSVAEVRELRDRFTRLDLADLYIDLEN